jgi:voltage-gated potassium channel
VTYPIPHNHPARTVWNILILVSILAFLFIITFRIVFQGFRGDSLYYALNALLFVDIGVNFTSKVKLGHLRLETWPEIVAHYLKGWFAVDVVAAFPFELIVLAVLGGAPAASGSARTLCLGLQAITLVKLLKAGRIFKELEESLGLIPSVRRLILFGYWLSAAIHLMALGWIVIGASESFRPPLAQYLRAFYWVTTTVATIGYGDYGPNHDSDAQVLYTIIVEILGVGMFSYIIANVSSLISNLDIARSSYRRRLDEVNAYLRSQRIPMELQERVRDYYSYLWEQQRGISASTVLEGIPRGLSQEILMFLNREVVNRVDLFRGAGELFLRESVQLLRPRVFLPGEYIIRQGEFGDCMYFLTSGEVRILVGEDEVARLGPGSPFGETALVEDLHRNASVVSTSYSTGYQLGRTDFDLLRRKYPDFDAQVRGVVERRKAEGVKAAGQ